MIDPCVPGVSPSVAKAYAEAELGVPTKYAKKMSVAQVCRAVQACKKTTIMPPMDLRVIKNTFYLIDPNSPLSIKDFLIVFGKGDIVPIAKKMKLITEHVKRHELRSNIIRMLESLNIMEPIKVPVRSVKRMRSNDVTPNVPSNINFNRTPEEPMNNFNKPQETVEEPSGFRLKSMNEIVKKIPTMNNQSGTPPVTLSKSATGTLNLRENSGNSSNGLSLKSGATPLGNISLRTNTNESSSSFNNSNTLSNVQREIKKATENVAGNNRENRIRRLINENYGTNNK
jgi:hypothetical protein